MLNILAYVRAKFREAALAGIQDALDEIDPVSARPGPSDGGEPPLGAGPVLPTPPAPPALGAGKPGGGDAAPEQEQPQTPPSLKQQIVQAAAAAAASANSTALAHTTGPSAARRDRRPRSESGP